MGKTFVEKVLGAKKGSIVFVKAGYYFVAR
jgi:hypothetical protein